jgi:hypothetical protein
MDERSFEELNNEEFRELLDRMGDDEATDLPAPVFFEALGAIGNSPPRMEFDIQVAVENGRVVAYGPTGEPLPDNALRLGNTLVRLVPYPVVAVG